MNQYKGDYSVDWTSDDKDGTFLNPNGNLKAMNVTVDKADLGKVEIKLNGVVGNEARGLEIYGKEDTIKTITIKDYNQVNNLTACFFKADNSVRHHSEITSIYAEKSTVKITGNTRIESIVNPDPKDTKKEISIAHNGIYAYGKGAAINLLGNTYINTNIPKGMDEAYDSGYRGGASKMML